MKAMNISSSSCASQTSTSIIHNTNASSSSSIDLKLQSSSSMTPPSRPATAPRLLDGSGGGAGGGGRAIDRHNPIVTDGKRSLHISGSLTNTPIPSPYSPSIITTTTTTTTTNSHSPSQKTKNSTTTKKKKNHRTAPAANKLPSLTNKNELSHHRHHQYTDQTILKSAPAVKKTVSNPTTTTTEIVTNSVKGDCLVRTKRVSLVKPWLQEYITQPDTDSARYLLASDAGNDDTTVNIHHEHAAVDTDGEDHDTGAVGFFDELLRFEKHDSHSDSIIKVGAPDSDNELVAANYSPSFSPSDCGGGTTTKDDATDHSYSITTTTSVTNNSKSLTAASKSPKSLAPSSFTSVSSDNNHQVVVLRVSLHCRGCEGKVRKHISRMKGVTSFNIDFAAKKVTVVGDVTPLGVLASISKVKTAQLWTPPASSMEINRRRTAVV